MTVLVDRLTGEIPGLLRLCSPAILDAGSSGASCGVVLSVQGARARVALWDNREPDLMPAPRLTLDTSDPTGRFHCRLWLQERGHNVGSEDRAEVLSWSVLSVWRGGNPLAVVGAWGPYGRYAGGTRCSRSSAADGGYACVTTGECAEWWAGTEYRHLRGPETEEAGKAAADAALLALGWALTNPDGSLTLPPLPEGAR